MQFAVRKKYDVFTDSGNRKIFSYYSTIPNTFTNSNGSNDPPILVPTCSLVVVPLKTLRPTLTENI